jgi:hypothetical protein
MRIPSKPWTSVLTFYEGLAKKDAFFSSMHRLVEHVAAQPYAQVLFCATSMHDLLVSQHAEIEWLHDMLRVHPASADVICFTFHEQPFAKPPTWECRGAKAVENFEGFLRKSKWVAR